MRFVLLTATPKICGHIGRCFLGSLVLAASLGCDSTREPNVSGDNASKSAAAETPSVDPRALLSALGESRIDNASSMVASLVDGRLASSSSVENFAVSIYALAAGDDRLLEQTRKRAFSSASDRASILSWIETNFPATEPPGFLALFLRGLAEEANGNSERAFRFLSSAVIATPREAVLLKGLQYTHRAADDKTGYVSMGIRETEALTYSGEMAPLNGGWIPVDGKFTINGGSIVSYFGGEAESRKTAHFGTWRHALLEGTSSVVSWAAMLVSGELYMPSNRTAQTDDATDLVNLVFESSYRSEPLDYWGKFKVISLNKEAGDSYPMLFVPFYDGSDGKELAIMVVGTTFRSRTRNFVQGSGSLRFFGQDSLGKIVNKASTFGRVYSSKQF